METISAGEGPREATFNFQYKLVPGVTQLKHYGVDLVKNIWPESVVEDVYKILKRLETTSTKVFGFFFYKYSEQNNFLDF